MAAFPLPVQNSEILEGAMQSTPAKALRLMLASNITNAGGQLCPDGALQQRRKHSKLVDPKDAGFALSGL
jgi:hypothetical protein